MHSSSMAVGIFGVTGYAGAELVRLISAHPSFELAFAQSNSAKGTRLRDLYPALRSTVGVEIVAEPEASGTDIAFLCLPAGESMRIVPDLLKRDVRVVDLGPDYRLKPSSLFEAVYKMKHTDVPNLETSTYGITELNRDKIGEAMIVANPGCYPTAALIALAPIHDIIAGPVIIDAKSGTSGSGKEPTQFNNHSEIGENIRPYSPNTHRHIHEITSFMTALSGSAPDLTFVPHLAPIVRGIEETIYLPGTPYGEVLGRLSSAYADSSFVHVVAEGSLNIVQGTNHCLLQVADTGKGTVVFAFIDNLVKGASGQAVQNANVMLGLPEETGLMFGGTGVGK